MNKYLSLLTPILMLLSCTEHKDAVDYVLPEIKIDSCVVASNHSLVAYLTVDKGETFSKHSAQLLVYNTQDVNTPMSVIPVELGAERLQKIQKTIPLSGSGNEFLLNALLKTERNSFKSAPVFVNLVKMTFDGYLHLWGQPRYLYMHVFGGPDQMFETDDVALHFSDRRGFVILVKKSMEGRPVEVKIGDQIIPASWDTGYVGDKGSDGHLWVEIPKLAPGTYDVALHFPEVDLPLPKKIRVLPGKLEVEETATFEQFRDLPNGFDTYFRIGDKMYYYDGMYDQRLVCCDLNTKQWTRLSSSNCALKRMVSLGSKAYGITEFYENTPGDGSVQNQLYEYDPATDTWSYLADLPVKGQTFQMQLFAAGGHLYICGGYTRMDSFKWTPQTDLTATWRYDITQKEWEQVADVPTNDIKQIGCGDTYGYILTNRGVLWVYDTRSDAWTRETQLRAAYPSSNRYVSLFEHDGKLYYAGNLDNSCIYSYDFGTKQWDLLALYGYNSINDYCLPATIHNGKFIIGPRTSNYYLSPCMYFLNFNIQ